MSFAIAIDGPAGAGKSTIARKLAEKLNFIYVDTGAMYRAMAYYFLEHDLDPENEEDIRSACDEISIELGYENGEQKVILNGTDISDRIRTPQVSDMASATSGYPFVRKKLLHLQQDIAATSNVIMDGRDIGTCVLPHAQLKIYLTASVHTRACRRFHELQEKGTQCSLSDIENDIRERDRRDMTRETAPLKQAEDAVLVDSSEMDIPQVVETIYKLYQKAEDGQK